MDVCSKVCVVDELRSKLRLSVCGGSSRNGGVREGEGEPPAELVGGDLGRPMGVKVCKPKSDLVAAEKGVLCSLSNESLEARRSRRRGGGGGGGG